MKYYISRTHVSIDSSGKITIREAVLTKPDVIKSTREMLRRMTALGIDNIHICEHPINSRRWGQLEREGAKLVKTRRLTMADVASGLAEFAAEAAKNNS